MRKKCVIALMIGFVLIIFNSCSDAPYMAEMEVYELGVFIDFYGKKIPPMERVNKMVLVTYSGLKGELNEDKLLLGTVTIPEKTEVTITVRPLDEENDYTDITTDDGENILDRVYTFSMERDRAIYITLSSTPIEKTDYYFGIDGNGYIDLSVTRIEDDSLAQRYEIRTNSKIALGKYVFEKHNVTLQAIASNDNVFEKWSDGSLNSTYKITSERDDTLTATFREGNTANFKIVSKGDGVVNVSIVRNKDNYERQTYSISANTEKTIPIEESLFNDHTVSAIAEPNKQAVFESWSGGTTDKTIKITKDSPDTITANFVNTAVNFNFAKIGKGFINVNIINQAGVIITNLDTVIGNITESTVVIPKTMLTDNTMRVKAVSEEWYSFNGWSGGITGNDDNISVTELNAANVIKATFYSDTIDFNFAKSGNGFITINVTNKTGNVITNLNALNPSTTSKVTIPKAMLSTNTMRIIAYPEKNNMFYKYSGGLVNRESSAIVTENNSTDTIHVDFLLLEQPKESYSDGWIYISKPEHIQWVANELNNTNYVVAIGKYKFKNDIDFAGKPHIPIGTYNSPFKGIIDGNNQALKGAVYTAYDSYIYASGLVGVADGATISNIIIDSSVVITNIANVSGGVVGSAENTIISNCVNNANVTADTGRSCDTGGIVGSVSSGTYIYNSYNTGSIKDGYNSGGIVGNIRDGRTTQIINVYNTGDINGHSAGGIAGYASNPNFVNAYSIAPSIVGGNYAGGLIGQYVNSTISLENSYHVHVVGNNDGFANMKGDSINRAITTANLYTLTSIFNTATPGVWKNITVNSVNRPVLIGVGEGK